MPKTAITTGSVVRLGTPSYMERPSGALHETAGRHRYCQIGREVGTTVDPPRTGENHLALVEAAERQAERFEHETLASVKRAEVEVENRVRRELAATPKPKASAAEGKTQRFQPVGTGQVGGRA
jgi:hypothetical protein